MNFWSGFACLRLEREESGSWIETRSHLQSRSFHWSSPSVQLMIWSIKNDDRLPFSPIGARVVQATRGLCCEGPQDPYQIRSLTNKQTSRATRSISNQVILIILSHWFLSSYLFQFCEETDVHGKLLLFVLFKCPIISNVSLSSTAASNLNFQF